MSMTYAAYGTLMAKLLAINPSTTLTSTNQDMLNAMIDYAELRIYRELDFLATQVEVDSTDMTPGVRTIDLPDGIIIANEVTVVTPASTPYTAGTQNPMQRTSTAFINYFWPNIATLGQPQFWTMRDNDTITVAPTPDLAYKLHCVGVVRPEPLYTDTNGTYITDNLPDLFVAASCVWGFGGINQNFGAMSDDPKSAQSWENQYQTLKASVNLEALRQKAWATSWQPYSPAPDAPASRT